MNTQINRRRRLSALAGSLALAGAASIAIATPSSAVPTGGCAPDERLVAGSGYVEGFNRYVCGDGTTLNLAVSIFKKVGDHWDVVAQGSGTAIYKCKGTALTTFSMNKKVNTFHCS